MKTIKRDPSQAYIARITSDRIHRPRQTEASQMRLVRHRAVPADARIYKSVLRARKNELHCIPPSFHHLETASTQVLTAASTVGQIKSRIARFCRNMYCYLKSGVVAAQDWKASWLFSFTLIYCLSMHVWFSQRIWEHLIGDTLWATFVPRPVAIEIGAEKGESL